ncbi:MAG: acyl-CoA dehydrogenase [Solirubrobacterales bacterium]
MSAFVPPLRDIKFVLEELVGLDTVTALPGFEEATADTVDSILTEAASIAEETIAPLNPVGDRVGPKVVDGAVKAAPGWSEAWKVLVDGGWNGLPFAPEIGGMGLPHLVNTACYEMWNAANMAFALGPTLTQGAVNTIEAFGSEAQKALFLPKLVSGEWAGTMNLTEAQAGSDLAAIRAKAVPHGDHYRISGQKIFISYGDHDITENIIHLVLARTPNGPAGLKGISLFIVPKLLIDDEGRVVGPNDVHVVSIEHKLGIHGSPTAVLSFGDHDGAIGYLLGEENRGVEYMFTMMNHARLSVGLQGLAIAERAYQQALGYARERVQGKPAGWQAANVPGIHHHPDVRRMLMSMKCRIEAMRGLLYTAWAAVDVAHHHADPEARERAQRMVELLTPVAKGWSTETGIDIASLGVQIHGGMGYIEETGAAQHLRDARITTIYEGTTGIQANDLVFRKILRDEGAAIRETLDNIDRLAKDLTMASDRSLCVVGGALADAVAAARQAVEWLLGNKADPRLPAAAAVPFLNLAGIVLGGEQIARGAAIAAKRAAEGQDPDGFYDAKLKSAVFYARHVLSQARGHLVAIVFGSEAVMALEDSQL